MNIGNKLKELRVAKGLTQEELADRCELSKTFISQSLTTPPAHRSSLQKCCGSSESMMRQLKCRMQMQALLFHSLR